MAYTLFVVLIVLVSLLMIFIVLIQESKGGGLASNFSSTNSIMGVRKTTDIVEKLTWGLAAAMVVISVACAYVAPQAVGDSSVMEGATQEQTALPAMPGASKDATAGAQQQSAPAAGNQAAPAAGNQAAPAAGQGAPAAGQGAQKAAPVVPASPAK